MLGDHLNISQIKQNNQAYFCYMNNTVFPFVAKIQYMDFYLRVKQLAKKKKLSLQELIISIGLNHDSYYSLQKAGNLPRADEALTIAQALNTTVEYLLMGTELKDHEDIILDDMQKVIDQHRSRRIVKNVNK